MSTINLIPTDARRKVAREYWLRVAAVWVVLVSLALAIVAVLQIPLYVLVATQAQVYQNTVTEAGVDREGLAQARTALEQANSIAATLNVTDTDVAFSEYVDALLAQRSPAVDVTSISLERRGAAMPMVVRVMGVAQTRQDLVRFRDAAEAHVLFDEVELPLSNLAQDEDIVFSVPITPAGVSAP